MTGQSPSESAICFEKKNSITCPVVIRSALDTSWNPPLEPRREVTKPPQTRSCRTFAVSAVETPILSAICCDCIDPLELARQHRLLSAERSRFGKPGQITAVLLFGVNYPKWSNPDLWREVHLVVIAITFLE